MERDSNAALAFHFPTSFHVRKSVRGEIETTKLVKAAPCSNPHCSVCPKVSSWNLVCRNPYTGIVAHEEVFLCYSDAVSIAIGWDKAGWVTKLDFVRS